MSARGFRFGVSFPLVGDRAEWIAKCRRAEELGYDVLSVSDHLGDGRSDPLGALAVAAAVTERPHVAPFVLDVPFYNEALLARHVATVAKLAGDGRLELGLGAGHVKSEFDDAGLPWLPARERVAQLARTVTGLRRRLGDDLPRLLIAGNSDGVLGLAAAEADTVGFGGLRQIRGEPSGTLTLVTPDELFERTEFVRAHARGRDPEFNLLIQHVATSDEPRAEIEAWAAPVPGLKPDADELLRAPQLLAGTTDEIAATLHERRERYGFSYVTVFEPALESFAPVLRALAGE
ncbi:TIGR03621 family F420-dependent LLM class oxidoreductase [Prauserella cavernicola]|uniref:TIGR03621 family F420-dependent LLM class oxidoreductase n=1 Tax=Prauserella cavernicola TaxID=2800127 RepID=A0A934QSJ9_9PSEU|nr:TIGR03621 family F420-dependent LLM class oxidoreductase [Prauserella cavernicola]MBK1785550.1 TIGR03621 family F420-dependent LLM class oxidoreductase [Prauserella cavernicola]